MNDDGQKIIQHPKIPTGSWSCMRNGTDTPIKSMRNHYGVRVATDAEVDRATEYLESKKTSSASRPSSRAKTITPIRFTSRAGRQLLGNRSLRTCRRAWPGKNHQPSLDHPNFRGTLPRARLRPPSADTWHAENDDLEASECFYKESLGLQARKALAKLVLRQTPGHTVVRGLHSSAESQPSQTVALSTLHRRSRIRGRGSATPIVNSQKIASAGNCASWKR